MTDQVTLKEEDVKNIFEQMQQDKAKDQKVTSDDKPEVKDVPDMNNVFNDQLKNIVDDKGEPKYKDVITALEALKHSQDHIKTLQEENKSYRDTKMEQDTVQQALDAISAKKEPETTRSEGIDAEQLKGMTFEAIQEYERQKQQKSNLSQVSSELVKRYGSEEKALAAYSDKASELGIGVETLKTLAAESPNAVLHYFSSDSKSNFNPTKGSINTSASFAPKKETVDYSARFFSASNPSVSKWREAGEDINN